MQNELHALVLGVSADAPFDEIKAAYRKLVRRNHPDLFPPEDRPVQQWKMVQINEAYQGLTTAARLPPTPARARRPVTAEAHRAGGTAAPGPQFKGANEASGVGTEVGFARDPAYVYYKQGFVHYSRGVGGMMDREKRALTQDANGLRRALYALGEFHRAHGYFSRVLEEFSESVWRADAEYKLRRIAGFNRVYHRIRRNLAVRLREQGASAGAETPSAPESASLDAQGKMLD